NAVRTTEKEGHALNDYGLRRRYLDGNVGPVGWRDHHWFGIITDRSDRQSLGDQKRFRVCAGLDQDLTAGANAINRFLNGCRYAVAIRVRIHDDSLRGKCALAARAGRPGRTA